MATVVSPPERLVILHGVSWETYERLLTEHGEKGGTRFTYDQGALEIMILSSRHEEPNRALASLVEVLAEEFGIDIRRLGSTTFKREDLQRGFEPDSCFYIQSAEAIAGKEEIDLSVDPAPDLVIEVDITSDSLNRLPLFAAVGVPEVWHSDGERVTILRREGEGYAEAEQSIALPPLTGAVAIQFLAESKQLKSTEWLRRVRQWAQARKE